MLSCADNTLTHVFVTSISLRIISIANRKRYGNAYIILKDAQLRPFRLINLHQTAGSHSSRDLGIHSFIGKRSMIVQYLPALPSPISSFTLRIGSFVEDLIVLNCGNIVFVYSGSLSELRRVIFKSEPPRCDIQLRINSTRLMCFSWPFELILFSNLALHIFRYESLIFKSQPLLPRCNFWLRIQ